MKLKIIMSSIIIIFIVITISTIFYFNSEYKLNLDRKNNLLNIGCNYYEEYYYPSVGEYYIKKYSEKSIKIPLSTLNNSKDLKDKINNKLFKKCDFNNTYVEIIPNSPYESKDYKTKVNLDC